MYIHMCIITCIYMYTVTSIQAKKMVLWSHVYKCIFTANSFMGKMENEILSVRLSCTDEFYTCSVHSRPRAGSWMSPVYLHRSMPSSSDAETCWRLWRDKNTLEGKLRI